MASNPTVDSFTADIQALRQELRGLKDELAGLSGGGLGGGSMMPTSLGRVSTDSFGRLDTTNPLGGLGAAAFLRGGLGKFLGFSGKVAGSALVATGAVSSAMPSMEKYTVRESGYYMAGLYSMGAMGRDKLRERTGGRLAELGGLTSVGADATVAAILSGRGLSSFKTDKSGNRSANPYYDTIMSQIGNVGRYMNMDNEVAAQSMANLTGGRTSASLLQRGIFTSNPLTGDSLKESDIFEQIANRFIVGDMSVDETQDEIRRGFLGANIESLDIDAAAKERLKMFLIARAGGQKVDFSSQESMSKAFGDGGALKGYTNPFADIYKINAAETGAIEDVSGEFAKGLADGVTALEELYSATQGLRQTFGALGATLATVLGNDLGATLGNPVTAFTLFTAMGANSLFKGIGEIGGSVLGDLQNGLGPLGGVLGIFPGFDSATGGGGMGDVNLGSNLALPVPAGSMPTAGYGKSGNKFWDGTHNGIDYGVVEDTPVYAAADGQVWTVATSSGAKSYGLYVKLRHANGFDTIYAHLQSVDKSIANPTTDGKPYKMVKKGQEIGRSGSSGTDVAHLHFEVQTSDGGKDVPPSQFTGSSGTGGGVTGGSSIGSPLLGGGNASSSGSSAQLLLGSSGGSGGTGGTTVLSGGGNNVTIHLNVASASEAEAVRFAEIVKQKLEEDSFMSQMGAK